MTELRPLLIARDGGVAWLTLNRPDRGNAIDLPLAPALFAAAIACDQDDRVRCIVVRGAGRMFCAGGDVAAFAAAGDGAGAFLSELAGTLHLALSRFARMAKPLVTVVHGPAAGAGFSLALAGDVVMAGTSAQFAAAYGAIGLSPDGGLTWLLPRLVGLRRAQDILLGDARIDAQRAVDLGLVTRTVADAALMAEAEATARRLAGQPVAAIGATRALLLDSFSTSLETQMEREARAIAAAGAGPEGREGVAAFLDKRKPDFHGV